MEIKEIQEILKTRKKVAEMIENATELYLIRELISMVSDYDKLRNRIDKVRRIDFEEGYDNPDGKFIEGLNEEISVLYNESVISYEEVRSLIDCGEYEYDNRVVVTTPTCADNLLRD